MSISYTITLFRNPLVTLVFAQHNLTVRSCREDELTTWERDQIKGPVAADGLLYFIHAQSSLPTMASFVWLESKEESLAVSKAIYATEMRWYQEQPCTFCGQPDCNEDHGDDMRDAQRAALARD